MGLKPSASPSWEKSVGDVIKQHAREVSSKGSSRSEETLIPVLVPLLDMSRQAVVFLTDVDVRNKIYRKW